jgi:Cu/Ag efflux pump CusA
MNFATLFSEFNPHLYFGGDSVAFWGPLAWTMIYGLSFATFLTLIIVPVMMLLSFRFKAWVRRKSGRGGKDDTLVERKKVVYTES